MDGNSKILERMAAKKVKEIRRSHSAYCVRCEKIVELFTFEDAAQCFNTDVQDIEFLSNRMMLHRIHNKRGDVMICSISLFDVFESRATRLLNTRVPDRTAN